MSLAHERNKESSRLAALTVTDHPHHACIRRAAFVRPRRIAECAESWLSHNVSSQATGQLMHLLLLT